MSSHLPEQRIERIPAVLARTGLSRSHFYLLRESGSFPRPVKLGDGRAVGFLSHEVDSWIAARARNRDNA